MTGDLPVPEDGRDIVVLRCLECGDTFPSHQGDDARCPSCGTGRLELADEPLL